MRSERVSSVEIVVVVVVVVVEIVVVSEIARRFSWERRWWGGRTQTQRERERV